MFISFNSTSAIATLLLVAGTLLPMAAHSQSKIGGVMLTADKTYRDLDKGIIELEGNVKLAFGDQYLSCDKAWVDEKKKEVIAEGRVILQNLRVYSEGRKLEYNYVTETGILHDGFVQSGPVVFEGKIVEKVGPDEYIAQKASYTACTTCPAAWSFSGQKIEAEIGGYAYIKFPVLRIGNVPVFALPAILVPLKSDRQSGLLVPTLGYNTSGGSVITQSYFSALSRSQDLTTSVKKYDRRGWKALFDYRYVLDENSKGQLKTAYIYDKAFEFEPNTTTQMDRAYADYHHHYKLPNSFVHRADLSFASDLRYSRDFPKELSGHKNPALENRISLTQNHDRQALSIEAGYYINLLKEDPEANNDDAVHRLPEINYSVMDQRLGETDFYFGFDLNFVKFARNKFSYDLFSETGADPATREIIYDRSCDPGDVGCSDGFLPRTGQRLSLVPSLYYPISVENYFEIVPRVSYNETNYRFDTNPETPIDNFAQSAARRYVHTEISGKTEFSSIFGDLSKTRSTRYKHKIEPELVFSTIPWAERPDHLFFGDYEDQPYSRRFEPITDGDFRSGDSDGDGRRDNTVQFDYKDRLFDQRLMSLILTNKLIQKAWFGSQSRYTQIAYFRLSQSFDFNAAKREERSFPWSDIEALLKLELKGFDTYSKATYHPYAGVTDTYSRVRFKLPFSSFVDMIYSQDFSVDADQNYVFANRREFWTTGMGVVTKRFNLTGRVVYSATSYKVESWQGIINIKPPGDCWGIQIGIDKEVSGDTDFTFNFNFQFGGKNS